MGGGGVGGNRRSVELRIVYGRAFFTRLLIWLEKRGQVNSIQYLLGEGEIVVTVRYGAVGEVDSGCKKRVGGAWMEKKGGKVPQNP